MTLLLLLGIGCALYFAPQTAPVATATQDAGAAAPAEAAPAIQPEAQPRAAPEVLAASEARPADPTPLAAATYVPFLHPREVMADGRLAPLDSPVAGAPEALAALDAAPAEPAAGLDLRYVSSEAVNVRAGPSTDFEVLGRVTFAEAVRVIEDAGEGWVRILIEGDGIEGYMAARFLQTTQPNG